MINCGVIAKMATKPLSNEAIALTEKKMDMSLDDIIKMSKTNAGKNTQRTQRVSNKSRGVFNGKQDRSLKVRQYTDSRSTLRQGALSQKRSGFHGNNFPLAAQATPKSALAPFQSRPINRRNAGNWNKPRYKPRPGGPLRLEGNAFNVGNAPKQQQRHKQHQHQHPLPRGEMIPNKNPKTLDSLFANMKEQRMRGSTRQNNGGNANANARVGVAFNQPRPPWLRSRFGSYRN